MNKRFLLCILFSSIFFPFQSFGQSGQWVWMKGDTLFNEYTNAVLWGVEDSSYLPDAFYLASTFKDNSGKFYLFGGGTWDDYFNGYDCGGVIWRYNPSTNNWNKLKGIWSSILGQYGIQGVPDSNNNPGSRMGSTIWKDNNGKIWMFGGGTSSYSFSDLWKYDIGTNNWTWMKGPDYWEIPGVYGIKGVGDSANNPPPRREAVGWVDSENNLWLFGGFNTYYNINDQYRNDLWMYNTITNEWIWQGGDTVANSGGAAGNKGVPYILYLPRSRACNCSWSDDSDNFYLYGGRGGPLNSYTLGDVWRYNKNTQEWTWLSGPLQQDSAGSLGAYCDSSENFFPNTRQGTTCVKLDSNKIFLFGGFDRWWQGLYASISNDAWIYDFKQNTWAIVSGDLSISSGNFGIQGIYDSTNEPRSRHGAISWKGGGGNIWIYGGERCSDGCTESDLWRFTFDTNCISFNVADATHEESTEINIYPNPATDFCKINFPSSKKGFIRLKSLQGITLIHLPIHEPSVILNLQEIPAGVYLIEIYSAGLHKVCKLIKQ